MRVPTVGASGLRRLHSGVHHRGSCQSRVAAVTRLPGRPSHCTFPHCSSCMRANFHPRHLGREIPAVIVLPVGGPLEAVAQRPGDKALPPCSKFCRHTQ